MSTTIRQLAELVNGQVHGDGDLVVRAARPIKEAQPGDITFLENPKNVRDLQACQASAVVAAAAPPANGMTCIQVADPLGAFVRIVCHLQGRTEPPPHGIDPKASIHPTAHIGEGASVYPFAAVGEGTVIGARCRLHPGVVIGGRCRLGDDVVLYPNVVLYDDTVLGNRIIVHANAVLGSDGFGYRFQQGRHVKVPQLGHLEIGDDVEIGAGCCIDRGTFGATRIGTGTKFDNLVHIAHNVQIGRHNAFAGQVGIAGSTITGDYVLLGGQVGISDHLHIGDRVVAGGQSGVTCDIPAGSRLFGTPANPDREQKRALILMGKLPKIYNDLRRIKRHLGLKDSEEAA